MCTNCGNDCCENCLGVAKGDKGEPGNPAAMFIPSTLSTTSNTYTAAPPPFPLGTDSVKTPFTAAKFNVYVLAGTGSLRIRDLTNNIVLYENTAITSTSTINIETAIIYNSAPLNIVPSANVLLEVEVKHNTGGGGNSIIITGMTLYYK